MYSKPSYRDLSDGFERASETVEDLDKDYRFNLNFEPEKHSLQVNWRENGTMYEIDAVYLTPEKAHLEAYAVEKTAGGLKTAEVPAGVVKDENLGIQITTLT